MKDKETSSILAMVVIAITLVLLGAGLNMGYFYLNNYFYGSYRLSAREKSIILVTSIIFPNLLVWALSKRGRDTIVQIIAAAKLKLNSIIIIAIIVIIMTMAINIISTEYMGIIFLALGFLLMIAPSFMKEHPNTLGENVGVSILLLGLLLGLLGMFMSSPKESTLPKGCISFGKGQVQCGYK